MQDYCQRHLDRHLDQQFFLSQPTRHDRNVVKIAWHESLTRFTNFLPKISAIKNDTENLDKRS